MKKVLLLALGMVGCLGQGVSAQSLFTTTNDFSQFANGAGAESSLYYADTSSVNGFGNTGSPGGADAAGSLELIAPGGWNGWLGGSDFSGPSLGLFNAIAPGSTRPWSPESGFGPGTLTAHSGIIAFDVYRGNLTDWNTFGINFNYNGYWGPFWATTATDFTGADGRTWTHLEVPYTLNAVAPGSLTYFGMALAENAGAIAGQTFYVDNFAVVPEPSSLALLSLGGLGALVFLRRRAAP